jgi:hypothetical protein
MEDNVEYSGFPLHPNIVLHSSIGKLDLENVGVAVEISFLSYRGAEI